MSRARQVLDDLARHIAEQEEARRPIPEPTPPGMHRRLCVAMSTFDDVDGAYFTIQSIRLLQPEVLEDLSFLVIDNHPEGAEAFDLKRLDALIPHLRYVPFQGYRSTAVRDLVFRIADADIVLCVDSHVLLRPGSLRALVDYYEAHLDSRDLVQGPLLGDDLETVVGSHFAPTWRAGMFGSWDTDERARDPEGDPFEIDMQGLGLFACRPAAWPGFNPRLRGFGGEEGYIHEKVRRSGGRVMCLPALGWTHRFARPMGPPYRNRWEDRIRNYRIGWGELGWDVAPMEAHFREHLGDAAEAVLATSAEQVANPFTFFDAIVCVRTNADPARWERMQARFGALGISWRVERFPAIVTPEDDRHGRVLTFRAVVADARQRGYRNVVVVGDDVEFLETTVELVGRAVADLPLDWDVLDLGAGAIAVNRTAFDRLLEDIPPGDDPRFNEWITRYGDIQGYLQAQAGAGTDRSLHTRPCVATRPPPTPPVEGDPGAAADAPNGDLALVESLAHQLAAREPPHATPEASPPGRRTRLGVVIPTDDDYDGVYFTLQALRLTCPDLAGVLSFVVADLHPGGRASTDLKHLDGTIPGLRYAPIVKGDQEPRRDAVVGEVEADIVLWVENGVLLVPGAVHAVMEHFDAHTGTSDLVVGPDGDLRVFACTRDQWPDIDDVDGRLVRLSALGWVGRPASASPDPVISTGDRVLPDGDVGVL